MPLPPFSSGALDSMMGMCDLEGAGGSGVLPTGSGAGPNPATEDRGMYVGRSEGGSLGDGVGAA